MLIVPIKLGNNSIGCIEISNKKGHSVMSDNDLDTLDMICEEIGQGLITYELKFNLKKEMDDELKHIKGVINECYNNFLIPMVTELNSSLMNIMKAEKYF